MRAAAAGAGVPGGVNSAQSITFHCAGRERAAVQNRIVDGAFIVELDLDGARRSGVCVADGRSHEGRGIDSGIISTKASERR